MSAAESTENRDDDIEATATEDPARDDDARSDARVPRARRARIGALVLVAAVVAAVSGAGWLYLFQYRVDEQTDGEAAEVVLDAATDGTVALLSYAPETLDDDLSTAKARLTGDFLNYYTDFTDKVVAPAAKEKSVKTEAKVVQAAIAELKPDSAVALLFVNQATTSTENPDGAFASSSIKVGLTKVDDTWLISSFDPV
ncbi:twin-arginine translocation pathway signal [Mycobacterium sp. PS03-16]|uniref:twin-arginine translocation pathway signal n=1 Tax=Mycobacterium sp. PS03-16 TaxID=2559611 RepID=UPI001073335E|nr:twin-arginine translocation pathway signal [Mycobacterium sp. PS03-16]TFV59722.1 twin-arginine translocation pathway signal [Mycobacterium sp. PS03-16]